MRRVNNCMMLVVKRATAKPKFICTDIHENCIFHRKYREWKNTETGKTYVMCKDAGCPDSDGNWSCLSRKAREDVKVDTLGALGYEEV